MENLQNCYDSSEEEEEEKMLLLKPQNPTPEVAAVCSTLSIKPNQKVMVDSLSKSGKEMVRNVPVTDMCTYGPQHPYDLNSHLESSNHNGTRIVTGVIEDTTVEDFTFENQYHTFNHLGHGSDASGSGALIEESGKGKDVSNPKRPPPAPKVIDVSLVDNMYKKSGGNANKKKNYSSVFEIRPAKKNKKLKKSVTEEEDSNDSVWAPYNDKNIHLTDLQKGTMTEEQEQLFKANEEHRAKRKELREKFDEEMDFDRMIEKKVAHLLPARLKAGQQAINASVVWHLAASEKRNYDGTKWTQPPKDLKPLLKKYGSFEDISKQHKNFVPKKSTHKLIGHTKGVQCIEFFPQYGHLLLSGSMDNTVKIWDSESGSCKQTYKGHSGPVRAINFSPDGSQFLTASFDRFLRLWDTETGSVVQTFCNRRVPYCIKFHPDDPSSFVIGDSNHMIVQFDTRSGEIVQEYNHHLQAVNSVTFIDNNTKFISTSDDKKILIWEYGIPVPIKYVSEPGMHSMPTVTAHPSGNYIAGQCLNNAIDVYNTAGGKFKLMRNKTFKGHTCAGYACQLSFSPNGSYLMSGDGEGKLCVWDWKNRKMIKKLKAHDNGPCIGSVWHPLEASKVATCGWDGLIKIWD